MSLNIERIKWLAEHDDTIPEITAAQAVQLVALMSLAQSSREG